jgi:hypothetical protein
MRLPDREIVGCITDIGINFTVADLQKPNAAHVQAIFEWFAELLLNATRETVEPAMRAAAEDTLLVADGFSCREQIRQACGREPLHTAELLARIASGN